MTCVTCKKDITIEVDHADVNGTDIDYDVERGHTLNCTDRNSGRIIHEDWKQRQEAEQEKNAVILHCDTCHRPMTDEELELYQWDYLLLGGAIHCMECRTCADDCGCYPCQQDIAFVETR